MGQKLAIEVLLHHTSCSKEKSFLLKIPSLPGIKSEIDACKAVTQFMYQSSGLTVALNNIKNIMMKYKIGILALQELRWKEEGIIKSGDYRLFYKGGH